MISVAYIGFTQFYKMGKTDHANPAYIWPEYANWWSKNSQILCKLTKSKIGPPGTKNWLVMHYTKTTAY